MHYITRAYTGLSLLLYLSLLSCGSPSGEDKNGSSEEFEKAALDLKTQIREVAYKIPSPSEVSFLLEATGAEFNQSLINRSEKVGQYASVNSKAALNLGIYSADIGYLVSYDKIQEALNYMNAAKKLAYNLGVSDAFDAKLIERFENNLARKDSLAYLLNNTISKTQLYLKNDDRSRLAALIVTGSFVEGLSIATGLIETYPKDILPNDSRNLLLTPLISVVLAQEKPLQDLIEMLSIVEKSAPVDMLLKDLHELEEIYSNLNIEEQIKSGRADLVLSDKTLSGITEKVAEIKASITE